MAELTTVARPYAKAAFEFAREAGKLADWSAQLTLAAGERRRVCSLSGAPDTDIRTAGRGLSDGCR